MAQNIIDLTKLVIGKKAILPFTLRAFYSVKEHLKMDIFRQSMLNVKRMRITLEIRNMEG